MQLFHKGGDAVARALAANAGLRRLVATGRVMLTQAPPELGRVTRGELYTSRWLWGAAAAERVLVFGHGGAFCANSPDTLGAVLDAGEAAAAAGGATSGAVLGTPDGALLYARRGVVLRALDRELARRDAAAAPGDAPPAEPEALRYLRKAHNPMSWLMHTLRKDAASLGVAPAPPALERRLAVAGNDWTVERAQNVSGLPLAITGTMAGLSGEARGALIERCPEIKMIFPSLADPNCFGAPSTLNKEACYAGLCVTNPPPPGC